MSQPKRPDEVELYSALRLAARQPDGNGSQPGMRKTLQLASEMGMPERRLYYLLDKWSGNGWWDWGMNQAGGWFEPEAPESLA